MSKLQDMGKVPPAYIFAAIIPDIMVVALYFFDHTVVSSDGPTEGIQSKKAICLPL